MRTPERAFLYNQPEEVKVYVQSSSLGPIARVERKFTLDLLEQFGRKERFSVLDVGTGPGWIPVALAKARRQWDITAIDYSHPMLDLGRRHAECEKVQVNWQQRCAENTGFPEKRFDLVISHFALHEFQNPAGVLGEMIRVCKPGGRIVIQDLVRPNTWIKPIVIGGAFLAHLFSPKTRRQIHESVAAAFNLQEITEVLRRLPAQSAVRTKYSICGPLMRLDLSRAFEEAVSV